MTKTTCRQIYTDYGEDRSYRGKLVNFWFDNEEYWFNCSPEKDRKIYEMFYNLLNQNVSSSLYLSPNQNTSKTQLALAYLEAILLYDQCIRHFYRGYEEVKLVYGKISLKLTTEALRLQLDQFLTPQQRCFLLMPYRHSFKKEFVQKALRKVVSYREFFPKNPYYRRFYYATLKSYTKLVTKSCKPEPPYNNKIDVWTKELLCSSCCIDAMDTDCGAMDDVTNNLEIFKESFRGVLGERSENKYTVSLSGGVDSMLCLYMLKLLEYDVVAIMINYNNRNSSREEVNFVKWWCSKLETPLYVRHIQEISRKRDLDREFYEKITKEIRFDMYRLVGRPVLLGHNKDDCLENVFSNIKNVSSLDNLLGMSESSEQYGVKILRPMLKFSKNRIVDLANRCKIPYLYDSTPKWSNRGKMRDNLIPTISDFDKNILEGLLKISEIYKDLYSSYDSLLLNSLINENSDGSLVKKIFTINYKGQDSFIYWRQIFKKLDFRYGSGFVKNKSIHFLIQKIKNKKWGKITLSKKLDGSLKPETFQITMKID